MKISLTKTEMCDLLSKALQTPVTDFSVLKGPKITKPVIVNIPLYTNIAEGMGKALRVAAMDVSLAVTSPNRKIESIKALRAVTCELSKKSVEDQNSKLPGDIMGLAEAKYAVEDWSKWINFVLMNNKYPKLYPGNYNFSYLNEK